MWSTQHLYFTVHCKPSTNAQLSKPVVELYQLEVLWPSRSLLVSLPVGVVLLSQAVRRYVRRMKMREGEEDGGDIYEEPDKMATVIPLSQNEAYVLSQQRN